MSDFIWYWRKGDCKIYTKKIEVAEKTMKQGIFIMGKKLNPKKIYY